MWELTEQYWDAVSVVWVLAVTASAAVGWTIYATFIERRCLAEFGHEQAMRLIAWERSDRQATILDRGWMTRWQWYWMQRRIYRTVAADLGYKPPAFIELRTKVVCHAFLLRNRLRSSS